MAKKKSTAWKNEFYYRAYELARGGYSDTDIAKLLDISYPTFKTFKTKRPTFRRALEDGRKMITDSSGESIKQFIYNRLPDELQELWDEINRLESIDNGIRRIEALLENKGIRARQHLFLHALIYFSYNPSLAMRKVNITHGQLNNWVNTDPDFAALVDEIEQHKKYFYVDCLHQRMMAGDTAAIIFANKTKNRDLGYGEQSDQFHHHDGEIETKATLSLDEMKKLPLKLRIELMKEMKRMEEENAKTNIIDALPPAITA